MHKREHLHIRNLYIDYRRSAVLPGPGLHLAPVFQETGRIFVNFPDWADSHGVSVAELGRIFTTAYDTYALRAFEFGAIDCLLKPISPLRLATALRRLSNGFEEMGSDAEDLPCTSSDPLSHSDKTLLSDSNRLWYVPVGNIIGAESLGAHSIIWLEGASPVFSNLRKETSI